MFFIKKLNDNRTLKKFKKLCQEIQTFKGFQNMINGELDDISDPYSDYVIKANILFNQSIKVQNMFNNEVCPKRRQVIIKNLLGKIGDRVKIWGPFHCDIGMNIEIGDNSFINKGCIIIDCAPVIIGKNVLIGTGVLISTAIHGIEPSKRHNTFYAKAIIIEDNVWIGAGSNILPGVRIGTNSVIGAGSVVTKDIPPNVLAYGNPCKVARKLQ